jgi:transcriptional regulator with XRE-family HTH domain
MPNIDRQAPVPDFSAEIWSDRRHLKKWRKLLGLGQIELKVLAGVSQATVSALERGVEPFSEPSRTKIWRAIADLRFERFTFEELMQQRTVDTSAIELMLRDPTGSLYPPEPGRTPLERWRGRAERLAKRCEQLAGDRNHWKYKAGRFSNMTGQLLIKIEQLRDILDLETTSAITASEAQQKIRALGLQKRPQVEEEFRSELAAAFQETRRTAAKK